MLALFFTHVNTSAYFLYIKNKVYHCNYRAICITFDYKLKKASLLHTYLYQYHFQIIYINKGRNLSRPFQNLFNFHFSLHHPHKPFHFVPSACTVLLLIPKYFAACLTVALLSMIYLAISIALSSI